MPDEQAKFRRRACAAILLWGMFAAVACEPTAPSAPEPVFGGREATANAAPLPSDVNDSALHGPCVPAAPPGTVALIDDFEDGDQRAFKEFQREGYWFSAADATSGEISPKPHEFAAAALPAEESTPSNRMAAHLVASGYSDWGVVWGTTLRWVDEGLKCPFNGSRFTGIRFRAKGNGQVRVNFGVPETVPEEFDGACKQKCYDTHSRVVMLTPEWETYEVPWTQLQQWGWGTQARFDPSRLLSLQFAVDGKHLPADFWLDDIRFTEAGGSAETPAP